MALNPGDTPSLRIASETNPADITMYFDIDLGIAVGSGQSGATPMTAVYVPDRAKLQSPYDVILYFHGHKKTSGIHIQAYLKDSDFALRDFIVNSRKRDVLLVAPTLGDKSGFGILGDAAQVDAYLKQILNGVYKHLLGGTGDKPRIRQLVLAAHSGGGSPMKTVASFSAMDKLVTEVWCLDCTYGGGKFWLDWATTSGHTLDRLWVFSTGSWWVDDLQDPTRPKGPDNPVVGKHRSGTGDDTAVIVNAARKKSLDNIEALMKPVPPNSNKTDNFTYGVAPGHNESVGFYFTKLVNSSAVIAS